MTDRINARATSPRANLSLALGVASVALQLIGRFVNGAYDEYAWIWYVMAASRWPRSPSGSSLVSTDGFRDVPSLA